MRIALRSDASTRIGSGHLMRCLTLAAALREAGDDATFICRDLPGNLIDLVVAQGFPVQRLAPPPPDVVLEMESGHAAWLGVPWQSDVQEVREVLGRLPRQDWLVVDSYALDCRWEEALRPLVGRIMVIDDLADRPHDCDLLLDQNLVPHPESRYTGLLPLNCRQLLGPRHALLRPEFWRERQRLQPRDGRVRRILIFFGGSDATNETAKALRALRLLDREGIAIDVVVGAANPHRQEIAALCKTLPRITYHCQIENIAELMARADLAIGAGGTTTWERCFLGLPSLTMVLAENQAQIAAAIAAAGATRNLGFHDQVTPEMIAAALRESFAAPEQLREMGKRAMAVMGGETAVPGAPAVARLLGDHHARS